MTGVGELHPKRPGAPVDPAPPQSPRGGGKPLRTQVVMGQEAT